MSARPAAAWLLTGGESGGAAARVVCFPHAGGNPRAFLGWQSRLGESAELSAVCQPGRGPLAREQPPGSIAEFADGVAAAIAASAVHDERPIYLFGHSLGALVAFEVARRLRDLPALRHLVASGCSAPSLLPTERVVQASFLEGRAFAEAVGFFGGLPPEILADEDLFPLLLPGVQADFRLVAGYRYRPAAPLPFGVSLINGRDDPHVQDEALRAWELETQAEPARHWVDGGHFHFEPDPGGVIGLLLSVLRADRAGPRGAGARQHIEMI